MFLKKSHQWSHLLAAVLSLLQFCWGSFSVRSFKLPAQYRILSYQNMEQRIELFHSSHVETWKATHFSFCGLDAVVRKCCIHFYDYLTKQASLTFHFLLCSVMTHFLVISFSLSNTGNMNKEVRSKHSLFHSCCMENKETKILQWNRVVEDPVKGFTLHRVISVQRKKCKQNFLFLTNKVTQLCVAWFQDSKFVITDLSTCVTALCPQLVDLRLCNVSPLLCFLELML